MIWSPVPTVNRIPGINGFQKRMRLTLLARARTMSSRQDSFPKRKRSRTEAPTCAVGVWLANCYFAHNSLRFPVLLPFFNASFRRPFHPLNRHPDPIAPTWRRPFPHCRVPSAQTPAPDRKSLPATISQSILVGPHPCRLDGALDPSYSSSPFRACTEAFYPASPSQSHEQAKVP